MISRFQQPEVVHQGRRSRWGLVFLIGCVVALYSITTRPATIPEGWGTKYEAALTEATAGNRNLVVAFHMNGCPPCLLMDRSVLGSAGVRSALADFVPVRVDVDKRPDLAARFSVLATPTYAVLDAQGRLIAKREGYQPVETFVTFLEQATAAAHPDHIPKAPHRSSVP